MSNEITLSPRFQGATGKGHGGYVAGLMSEAIIGRATVDFSATIPLGRPLQITTTERATYLNDGDTAVLRIRPTTKDIHVPAPVTIEQALAAQARSPVHTFNTLPDCFSCGTGRDSMNVHAGPVDGRDVYATTWTPSPESSGGATTVALPRYVWGAIDCPSGWIIGTSGEGFRMSVTGEMWAEVFAPVRVGVTHVLVAWGDTWRGRRANAGTSLFDADGTCLAAAQSMWIATESS